MSGSHFQEIHTPALITVLLIATSWHLAVAFRCIDINMLHLRVYVVKLHNTEDGFFFLPIVHDILINTIYIYTSVIKTVNDGYRFNQ